ncbi:GYDIA family GHMP kinase [Ancylomarina longa]|uniref:GHMP kinase n=1 Tax=Ancylomarina longa TaxID=2487017 RepID=A0A434AUI3_9BACT|nr:GYDIA family GHMP kinase [Ancylomarina longa]RUT78004.1 GHMP kinase [Ancylomarina longa]
MNPINKYYSNAKFLITGEYLVLHGALAFAVPLKFGQSMEIYPTDKNELQWVAFEQGKEWLQFTIQQQEIEIQKTKGKTEKEFICFLLNKAKTLNSNFLLNLGLQIKTEIDFNRNWGLGSSSSLINNIAQWANINPYELHALVSNGSGYDIASANYCKPILFCKNGNHPLIYPVDFSPSFSNQLYFVYQGNKQSSEESVNHFLNIKTPPKNKLNHISNLSRKITKIKSALDFDLLLADHEEIISGILDCQPVKTKHFTDFKGSMKSLGAWGGDFLLIRSDMRKNDVHQYFFQKGLTTIFSWNEIILG